LLLEHFRYLRLRTRQIFRSSREYFSSLIQAAGVVGANSWPVRRAADSRHTERDNGQHTVRMPSSLHLHVVRNIASSELFSASSSIFHDYFTGHFRRLHSIFKVLPATVLFSVLPLRLLLLPQVSVQTSPIFHCIIAGFSFRRFSSVPAPLDHAELTLTELSRRLYLFRLITSFHFFSHFFHFHNTISGLPFVAYFFFFFTRH